MSQHYSTERLHDAIDGELSAAELELLENHVDDCAACRQEYARLSETVEALRALSTGAKTPATVWEGIAERMEGAVRTERVEATVLALPGSARHRGPRRISFSVPQLAAAAIAVAAMSAALALSIVNRPDAAATPIPLAAGSDFGPAAMAVASDGSRYDQVVAELERIMVEGREVLAPETLETIDASLQTVDAAIAEVREALSADPASDLLMRMLSTHQRTRLRVLQRAADAVRAQT